MKAVQGVLVDTSVWVDHFRHHNSALVALLGLDMAMTHPMVVAELACGTPPAPRVQTLADIGRLQQTQLATLPEVMALIEREIGAATNRVMAAAAKAARTDMLNRVRENRAGNGERGGNAPGRGPARRSRARTPGRHPG